MFERLTSFFQQMLQDKVSRGVPVKLHDNGVVSVDKFPFISAQTIFIASSQITKLLCLTSYLFNFVLI